MHDEQVPEKGPERCDGDGGPSRRAYPSFDADWVSPFDGAKQHCSPQRVVGPIGEDNTAGRAKDVSGSFR